MNAVATPCHHLSCIIQANNPKATATDGQGESVASLAFSVEHAITVGWTVAAPLAPNAERPAFLSLPTSPAVSFTNHQSLITWSALVAATPRCDLCDLFVKICLRVLL